MRAIVMFRLSSILRPCALWLTLAGASVGMGQVGPLESLVANSPFAPKTGATAAAPTDAALEFRGVFTDQGELFFSIYDAAKKGSTWVALNESGHPFTVRSYDADAQSVTAEHRGRTLTLALRKAPNTGFVPMPVPNVVTANQPPAPGTTVEAGSEDEAKRLAAVAAEIRRRRALRQQVAVPSAAPPPAQTP